MIHYTIDEKDKTIIVLAVLHTSRNPELWKNR
jgi:plasmid stabilization system protein ParE